jgi:hypothetical protein
MSNSDCFKLIFSVCRLNYLLQARFPKNNRHLEIGPSLNPNNPFKNVIYVSNNGYFPITDVSTMIKLPKIVNDYGITLENGSIDWNKPTVEKLNAGHKYPINMEDLFYVPLDFFVSAEIIVKIEFKLWPIKLLINEEYRFVAKRTYDNKLIWIYSN